MSFPEKLVLINNLMNIEKYLDINIRYDLPLNSLNLEENLDVKGVKELLSLIPDGYDPEKIRKFYEKTGLKILVEAHDSHYVMIMYDKDGRYPREDACLWNRDFMDNLEEHPEWIAPQEEPDILIRYIQEIELIQRDEEKIKITFTVRRLNK